MDRFTLWVGSYPHPFFQGGLGTNAAQEEGEMKLQIRYRVRRIIAMICSMGVVCCGQFFCPLRVCAGIPLPMKSFLRRPRSRRETTTTGFE